jgi:uncharacterized protein YkwD
MFRAAGVGVFGLVLVLTAACVLPGEISPALAAQPSLATYTLPYRLPSPQPRPDLELRVLNLVNHARGVKGLPPLAPHLGLRSAARAHGAEMLTHGFFSHRSLDGRTPGQRVRDGRVGVRLVGENLALAPDVQTAHRALMNSRDHRRNILSSRFRLVGIAVLDGGAHGLIIVQDFADGPADRAVEGQRIRAGP